MLIAREKKKYNIAEYILYIWQVENIIRSKRFDLDVIVAEVISQFEVSEEIKAEMKMWYQDLIHQMMKEGIADTGHLRSTLHHVEELNNLHNSLLTTIQDKAYQSKYLATETNISAFMHKSGGEAKNEIHACFLALFGFLMLKLKQADIGSETKEAMKTFSELLAELVKNYNKLQNGKLNFSKEQSN